MHPRKRTDELIAFVVLTTWGNHAGGRPEREASLEIELNRAMGSHADRWIVGIDSISYA